jgi:hypothetical protein
VPLHINEDKAKWAACDLVKGPLCLKELVPHVPAQRMPDAVTVQEGDGCVAVVAVVVGNRDAPFTMFWADMASGARF